MICGALINAITATPVFMAKVSTESLVTEATMVSPPFKVT